MITTRTVCVLNMPHDVCEYIEWLAAQAWPVVRVREVEGGRYMEITFAI